jgi:ABC-type multidrug transport system permease subunit
LAGGFVLSKGSTHPWTIWLYWSTPLSYAQNALSINEFAVRAL